MFVNIIYVSDCELYVYINLETEIIYKFPCIELSNKLYGKKFKRMFFLSCIKLKRY